MAGWAAWVWGCVLVIIFVLTTGEFLAGMFVYAVVFVAWCVRRFRRRT